MGRAANPVLARACIEGCLVAKEDKAPVARPVVEGVAKALFWACVNAGFWLSSSTGAQRQGEFGGSCLKSGRARSRWSHTQWAVNLLARFAHA